MNTTKKVIIHRGVRRFRTFSPDTMAIIREVAKRNGVPLTKRGRVHAHRTGITPDELKQCAECLSKRIGQPVEFGIYYGKGKISAVV